MEDYRIVQEWDDFLADYHYLLLKRQRGLARFLGGEWAVATDSMFRSKALAWQTHYSVENIEPAPNHRKV